MSSKTAARAGPARTVASPATPATPTPARAQPAPANPGWSVWALSAPACGPVGCGQHARVALGVGPRDDPLEREADATARAVVAGTQPAAAAGTTPPPEDGACPSCQRKATEGSAPADTGGGAAQSLQAALSQARTAAPMHHDTRQRLQSRLGADLGDVRVHDGAAAHAASAAIGARAFTRGSDIWLGRGESQADLSLMAHESTHVLQQRRGQSSAVQRQTGDRGFAGFTSAAGATGAAPIGAVGPVGSSASSTAEPLMSLTTGADFDPCAVAVSALSNAELLAQWQRVVALLGPRRPDSDRGYDLAHLRRRLAEARQHRGRQGHCWLAEPDLAGVPSVLYEMRASGPLSLIVTFADATREAGPPFEHLGQVLTPRQFSRFLEQQGVPQISLEDYQAATGGLGGPLEVHLRPPPPLLEVRPILPMAGLSMDTDPFGLDTPPGSPRGTRVGIGPAATLGLLPTDLYANPTELYARRSFLSPVVTAGTDPTSPASLRGAGVNWRGTMLESLHFGRDLATMRSTTDLNELRANFETFDGIVLVDGRPTSLESITHSDRPGFYASKFARMLNPGATGATLGAAATSLGAEYPSITSPLDAAAMAHLLVPDDHLLTARGEASALVEASNVSRVQLADLVARRLADPLGSIQPAYTAMLDASLAAQPVVRGGNSYTQWSQVAALNPRTAECRAVRAELAQRLGALARNADLRAPAPGSVEALMQALWRREAAAGSVGPMFDALLAGKPIGSGPDAITNWAQLEALMLSGDATAATRVSTAFSELSGRAAARVLPAGASMRALLTLEAMNRMASSRLQRNQLFPPEVVEYHRLVAGGVAPEAAEMAVLRGSAARGAMMSGGLTALTEGGMLMWEGAHGGVDGRRLAMAGYNLSASVPAGYAGAALETRAAMGLSGWATSGLAAGEAPGLAASSAVVGGRLFVSTGIGAVAAPVITLGGMAFQETFFDADFTRIDYAATGARTAVAGGGGALAAGITGAVLGSEVPLLGNAVGFVVGFGGYLIVDAIWGDDIEAAVREELGEGGCVGRSPPP